MFPAEGEKRRDGVINEMPSSKHARHDTCFCSSEYVLREWEWC